MAAECMVRDGKAKSSNNLNLPLFSAFLPPASIARSSAAMSDRPACSTFWQLMKRTGRPFASPMVSCHCVARLYQGSSPCMSKVTCFVVNFLSLGDGLVLRGVFFLAVAVFLDDAVFLANAAFLAVPVAVAVFFFVFDTVSRGFFAFIFFCWRELRRWSELAPSLWIECSSMNFKLRACLNYDLVCLIVVFDCLVCWSISFYCVISGSSRRSFVNNIGARQVSCSFRTCRTTIKQEKRRATRQGEARENDDVQLQIQQRGW